MFNGCNYLSTIYCTNDWSVTAPNLTQSGLTFGECKSLAGENGTVYDPNFEDVTYARPDGGKDAPGYFATTPFVVTILSEHGTVTVAEKRINLNRVRGYTTLHLTAEPEDGYIFTAWENYDPETGLIVTSDTTVTAVYIAIADLPDEYYALFKGKNTLTLRYDNLRQTLGKTCQMEDLTLEERNQITRIEIAPSVAQASIPTLYNYFSSMPNLEVVEGLQYINTSGISDVSFMFFNCAALKTIDLTGFDLSNVTSAAGMFMGCTNLTTITCKADYTSLAGSNSAGMFDGCTSLVGGNGTTYSPAHKDASYARPDRGTDAPGYFTYTGTYIVTATVTPEEAGKVYFNHSGEFAYGEEFEILLIPAEGYELVEWRQDGTPLEQKTLTISGIVLNDIHIEAVMKKNNPTGLEDVQSDDVLCTKLLRNGILYILRNGKTYNANGQLLFDN
jgi:surface protein